jgi:T5SS/PEP-CTERM-associated repeat protein
VFVGRNNTGTLNVTGGGRLNSRLGFIGIRGSIFSTSSGLVQIDGIGSSWTSTEQLFVGYEGQGTLAITAGSHVTSGTGHIGFTIAGAGTVRVSGAGSRWTNTESLYVGVAGAADLSVSNGGTVVVDDLLSISPRGLVQGNSTIVADVSNGGAVAPGVSPSFNPNDFFGTLSIDGNYTQTAAGKLQIQLDSATTFDKLRSTGQATLNGALEVTLGINSSLPAAGSMFEILHANGGVFNTFATTSLPSLGADLGWKVIYTNFSVFLQTIDRLPGDYNQNGVVDAADYVVWRDGLGTTYTQADYDVWRANFGQTIGSGTALPSADPLSIAVPEPATWVMLLTGTLAIFSRRSDSAPCDLSSLVLNR